MATPKINMPIFMATVEMDTGVRGFTSFESHENPLRVQFFSTFLSSHNPDFEYFQNNP